MNYLLGVIAFGMFAYLIKTMQKGRGKAGGAGGLGGKGSKFGMMGGPSR